MPILQISDRTCIVRNTGGTRGRTRSIGPEHAAVKHLRYGRIVLAADDPPVDANTGGLETALVALMGESIVSIDGLTYTMHPYDALYMPRETRFQVRGKAGGCDLAEIAA